MDRMQIFKTVFGSILFISFISLLGYKLYKSVEDMEAANLILWLAAVIIIGIIFLVRRILTY